MTTHAPVLIVGAGPAGLATGASLRQAGREAILFEAGAHPGNTWLNLYDRLHLHTVKQLSGLPGWPFPADTPRYPSRVQVAAYLQAYAEHFALDVRANCPVTRAEYHDQSWHVTTPLGEYAAPVLVSTTGIFSNPRLAHYPGEQDFGKPILHAAAYHNGAPFQGQRVLVVGAGNSGAEIAIDLAESGAQPTIAIRAGTNVVPRELLGVPIQRWAHVIAVAPPALTRSITPVLLRRSALRQQQAGVPRPAQGPLSRRGIPVIGLDLLRLVQSGAIGVAGAIDSFLPGGVRFADGHEIACDAVIMATGYLPALQYLAGAGLPLDADGQPRTQGVRALDAPDLYFVGMHYDIRGTLYNIAREAPQVTALITSAP